ncbi:hypothetical protein [Corynebacterium sp. H78]|uniref:hypothetical protein n=1 Tax=Corynebacterium sp. H78 TaxID=3133417 RepID=UPI0030A7706F
MGSRDGIRAVIGFLRFVLWALIVISCVVLFFDLMEFEGSTRKERLTSFAIILSFIIGAYLVQRLLKAITPRRSDITWSDGHVGVGKVQSYTYTGSKNGGIRVYNIAMDVQGDDGVQFQGQLRAPVGRKKLAFLDRKPLVPVMYRESQPTKLMLPERNYLGPAQLFFNEFCRRHGLIDDGAYNADLHGVPITAEVLSIEELYDAGGVPGAQGPGGQGAQGARATNQWNSKRLFDIALALHRPNGTVKKVRKRMWLDDLECQHVTAGATVDVKVLPHDENSLIIKVPLEATK